MEKFYLHLKCSQFYAFWFAAGFALAACICVACYPISTIKIKVLNAWTVMESAPLLQRQFEVKHNSGSEIRVCGGEKPTHGWQTLFISLLPKSKQDTHFSVSNLILPIFRK